MRLTGHCIRRMAAAGRDARFRLVYLELPPPRFPILPGLWERVILAESSSSSSRFGRLGSDFLARLRDQKRRAWPTLLRRPAPRSVAFSKLSHRPRMDGW